MTVRTCPYIYQVIKYRPGTIPNDLDISHNTLVSDAVHQLITDSCKIGHMVLDAESCELPVDPDTHKLVGDIY